MGWERKKRSIHVNPLKCLKFRVAKAFFPVRNPYWNNLCSKFFPLLLFLPPFTPFITGKLLLVPLFLCVVSILPPAWLMLGGKYTMHRIKISKPHVLYFRKQAKWEKFNFHIAVTYSHTCSRTEVNINNGKHFSSVTEECIPLWQSWSSSTKQML